MGERTNPVLFELQVAGGVSEFGIMPNDACRQSRAKRSEGWIERFESSDPSLD